MSKDKISDYSATANSNTDIAGINIDEGCAPSGINDAIRTLMKQLKDFQQGTNGDSFNGPVGSTTRSTGAFTSISTTGDITIDNGSADGGQLLLASSGYSNWGIDNYSGNFRWYYNTSEKMRLDNSGNLGLGVTPSAWGTANSVKALQTPAGVLWNYTSGNLYLGQNYYFNGSNRIYLNNTAASEYQQNAGAHYWYTAPSGTAGNAITFTQAMTLDASGNLALGTTSIQPNTRFDVRDVNRTGNYSNQTILTTTAQAADIGGTLGLGGLYDGSNSTIFGTVRGAKENSTSSNYAGYLAFGTVANGSSIIERARIDSSGNLLVGTTDNPSGVKFVVGGTSATARVEPRTDNVGYIGESSYRWQAVYAVNGTIQTSDGREKNTIQDSNLGLAFVNSLRPVSYKWNVGENVVTYDEEGKEVVTPRAGVRTHYGFIAQEVKAAIPEGVDFGGFVQEPNDGMMSLRYHEFIGPLVKAIQEQQAIINAQASVLQQLQADVAALKG